MGGWGEGGGGRRVDRELLKILARDSCHLTVYYLRGDRLKKCSVVRCCLYLRYLHAFGHLRADFVERVLNRSPHQKISMKPSLTVQIMNCILHDHKSQKA